MAGVNDHRWPPAPEGVRRVVLCFVLTPGPDGHGDEVLLGRKKRGFGLGKVVGLGGHIEPGEDESLAASRELEEESGLRVPPTALAPAGAIMFAFPARPAWSMHTTLFVTGLPAGGLVVETDEIAPQWFAADALPYESMWSDAAIWIPRVLAGEVVDAHVTYADDNQAMAQHVVRTVGRRT